MPLPKGRSPAVPIPGTVRHLARGPVTPTAILCPECRKPTLEIPDGFTVARRFDDADKVITLNCCGKRMRIPLTEAP